MEYLRSFFEKWGLTFFWVELMFIDKNELNKFYWFFFCYKLDFGIFGISVIKYFILYRLLGVVFKVGDLFCFR